ncbi:hypothetical protein RKD37_000498 [Streptomyces ambofaciens]
MGRTRSYVRAHGTRTAKEGPGRSAARCARRPGGGSGGGRVAGARRAGRGRCGRGDRWCLRVRVPVGDGGVGGCAVVDRDRFGGGHRGHARDPRSAAAPGVVDGGPPQGRAGGRRDGTDRTGHRRGLRAERGGEARRRRGASVPCARRGGRRARGVPGGGGLVVPEQPRHPRRRAGRRSRRAASSAGRDHAAAGRGGRAAARAGGGALPARCARRCGAWRRRRGGGAPRAAAPCPAGGLTAGRTAAE